MRQPVSDFLWGFQQAWQGLRYFHREPQLRIWQIISILFGIVFFAGSLWLAVIWLVPLMTSWLPFQAVGEGLLAWIGSIFWWITFLAVSLLTVLLTYLASLIFAGPLNALIAEKTFVLNSKKDLKRQSLSLAIRMIFYGLFKVVFFLMVGLICFALSFIPGLNLLAAFVLFMLISYDLSDYAFEVDQVSLLRGLQFLITNFWVYCGFAAAVSLTHFIPGAFFLLAPGFVCASTKIYIQLSQRGL